MATLTLTEAQADAFTGTSNPHNFFPLRFDGGDADGIYDIFLKLQEHELCRTDICILNSLD